MSSQTRLLSIRASVLNEEKRATTLAMELRRLFRDMEQNVEAMCMQRKPELDNMSVRQMTCLQAANHLDFKMFMHPEALEEEVQQREAKTPKRELQDSYCMQAEEFLNCYRARMEDLLEDVCSSHTNFEK